MCAQKRLLRCNHCRKNWDPVQLHEGEHWSNLINKEKQQQKKETWSNECASSPNVLVSDHICVSLLSSFYCVPLFLT